MKIRRKLPKPPRSGRPLYVIGYSSDAPALSNLRSWFDVEYGGPLKDGSQDLVDAGPSPVLATHGPWSAWLHLALPPSEAEAWKQRLAWRHDHAGTIVGTPLTPRHAVDTILHAARLARGLTLLTEGTAFDAVAQAYFNPADWTDRPLDHFQTRDHVVVSQAEAAEPGFEWFFTRGLSKFGLDEIETFRPVGLPTGEVMGTLADIADELLRGGRMLNVGLTLPLPGLGLSIQVIRHRTESLADSSLAFREVTWTPLM
jgi:hypothetical protein